MICARAKLSLATLCVEVDGKALDGSQEVALDRRSTRG